MTIINTEHPILIDLPMPIETDRLILRAPQAGDGAAMNEAKLETWDMLHQWMPWAVTKSTVEEDEITMLEARVKFLQRTDLMMLALEKDSGQFVGGTGLHRFDWEARHFEIGYWYRQSAQGKGYATESTKALIRYAFDVCHANKVFVEIADGNTASQRVAARCGFQFESTKEKSDLLPNGECVDHYIYSLFNADHLNDFNVHWTND